MHNNMDVDHCDSLVLVMRWLGTQRMIWYVAMQIYMKLWKRIVVKVFFSAYCEVSISSLLWKNLNVNHVK